MDQAKVDQFQQFVNQHSIEKWAEILRNQMTDLQVKHKSGIGIDFSFHETLPIAHLVLSDYLSLEDVIGSLAAYCCKFKNGPEERITLLEVCHYLSKVLEKVIVKIPCEESEETNSPAGPKSNLH